ncbi:MAG: patatin-like phospholipase family protein [Planctomycetes bacterium]|nr:patatin-like phospholipase family protein [Planctomycetota bacterium]
MFAWLMCTICSGQTGSTTSPLAPRGPRVGLVLSGGGARGAAHIGVLRVLEELHIPIHAISGTSMGSVVGGLYAIGYAPDELIDAIGSVEWNAAFSDRPPRRALAFRRKEEDRDFFARLELGWRNGSLAFPRGFITGQALLQILERLVNDRLRGPASFDALPLPFRCVTTDLENGEVVVLRGGDLATSIRASMSVPGAFNPVEIDGRPLVDGGLVQNLPVAACREMDVDVIIAVDIGTPLRSREGLLSVFAVSGQLIGLTVHQNNRAQRRQLAATDVLIVPELGDFSPADFSHVGEAIALGEKGARAAADRLKHLSVGPGEWQRYLLRQRRPSSPPRRFGEIRIEGDEVLAEEAVRARAGIAPGDPFDADALDEGLRRLHGLSVFESVEHDLGPGDVADLTVSTHARELGRGFLRIGARYEDDLDGENELDFATQFTWMPLNGWGGEWRSRAQIGQEVRFDTEIWQPLDKYGFTFVEPRIGYVENNLRIFQDGRALAEYRVEGSYVGLDAGAQISNWGELRAGIEFLDARAAPRSATLVSPLPRVSIRQGRYRVRAAIDTLDDPSFPRSGLSSAHELGFVRKSLGSDEDFATYEGSADAAYSIGRWTLAPSVDYGASIEGAGSLTSTFSLGGFLNLSGEPRRSRSGRYLFFSSLTSYVCLGERAALPIENEVFLGGSLEFGNVYADRSDITVPNSLFAGSVFLGAKTVLGPGYLGLGFTEGGESIVFVALGPAL